MYSHKQGGCKCPICERIRERQREWRHRRERGEPYTMSEEHRNKMIEIQHKKIQDWLLENPVIAKFAKQ